MLVSKYLFIGCEHPLIGPDGLELVAVHAGGLPEGRRAGAAILLLGLLLAGLVGLLHGLHVLLLAHLGTDFNRG